MADLMEDYENIEVCCRYLFERRDTAKIVNSLRIYRVVGTESNRFHEIVMKICQKYHVKKLVCSRESPLSEEMIWLIDAWQGYFNLNPIPFSRDGPVRSITADYIDTAEIHTILRSNPRVTSISFVIGCPIIKGRIDSPLYNEKIAQCVPESNYYLREVNIYGRLGFHSTSESLRLRSDAESTLIRNVSLFEKKRKLVIALLVMTKKSRLSSVYVNNNVLRMIAVMVWNTNPVMFQK